MQWRVPLADLDYGEEEKQAVLAVLESRWLTMGAVTQEFERRFAATVGARYAVAVSNATVALHLACLALGIGPQDEVIVPHCRSWPLPTRCCTLARRCASPTSSAWTS